MADDKQGAADTAANEASATAGEAADAAGAAQTAFNERVMDPARRAGEAMRQSGQRMAEGGSKIGVRIIDQAETNAQEAFAAMRRAAQAQDLAEVMRVQAEYLREQGDRSMAQAREIGDLIMRFGRDAVSPLRGGQG